MKTSALISSIIRGIIPSIREFVEDRLKAEDAKIAALEDRIAALERRRTS
jgi:hypothetical protein